jgi:hypothetical protein
MLPSTLSLPWLAFLKLDDLVIPVLLSVATIVEL